MKLKRWARLYDSCQKCGTTKTAHVAKGLCQNCYAALPHIQKARKEYIKQYYKTVLAPSKHKTQEETWKQKFEHQQKEIIEYRKKISELTGREQRYWTSMLHKSLINLYLRGKKYTREEIQIMIQREIASMDSAYANWSGNMTKQGKKRGRPKKTKAE